MNLSKEKFKEIINRLIETDDIKNKVNAIIRESTDSKLTDFVEAGSLMICHEDLVVGLLEIIFKDTDILSWWLYEKDYGRKFEIGDLTDNGKAIDLTTIDKLYDYLIEIKQFKE